MADVTTPDTLQVELVPAPPLPLVLADNVFLSALKQVEAQVATFKITDAQSAQAAADLQTRLTNAGSKLEKARVALVAPFLAQQRAINTAAEGPADRITTAKKTLSTIQTNWAVEQQRLARVAEQERQRQLAALEAQRVKEAEEEAARQAELQRQADEVAAAAAKGGVRIFEFDEEEPAPEVVPPTATEQRIAEIVAAPVVIAPKPVGVRLKVTLNAIVEDVNKLADIFVKKTENMAAIKAAYCQGWREGQPIPVCAGVRFEVSRTTESTGRGGI